jgi:tRNA-dihydrouridine synthase
MSPSTFGVEKRSAGDRPLQILNFPSYRDDLNSAAPTAVPETLRSGALVLSSAFVLAPMEAVSDVGFRAMCHAQGAALTYTEMVRARAVAKRNRATLDLIDTFDSRTPTGVQLLVAKPEELLAALEVLEELAATTHPHFKNICAIDMNFGCPSPDVVKMGAGPALLKRRARLGAIFQALADYKKRAQLPVKSISAKIRLGLNQREQEHKVYLPVIEMANSTLDHLVVHARHAQQRSRDLPTWSAIGEIKARATIPVIGNGDVNTRADAERMQRETGCDGFMIARAAIRDPFVFRSLTGRVGAPAEIERAAAEREYFDVAARFHTKDKFVQFHRENFARLRPGAATTMSSPASVFPKNAHMS